MARPARPPSPRRQAAFDTMRDRHAAVAAHFAKLYGFVLSEQVALLAALFTSLDDDEKRAARALELAPAGATTWFTHGIDRPLKPGLDARLDYRYWCTPPEAVTILTGGADGLHFGLFHDACDKPAWLVVQCYARDDAMTTSATGRQTTILDHLHILVRRAIADGIEAGLLLPAIEELAAASEDIVEREHRPKKLRGPILRYDAILVGSDLFFLRTRYQTEAVELLTRGYEAIGRAPLAEIVRLQHAHRDLASVHVFA